MTRDARKLIPQRLPEGQNGVGFNRVSCKMDENDDFMELFVSFKVDETLLEQGADAFWSFS